MKVTPRKRFNWLALLAMIAAISIFGVLRLYPEGDNSGPPGVGELVENRDVYYGKDLAEAQTHVDFTVAVPEYLPPGYTMDHVLIRSGISSDELYLQAGFVKGPEGSQNVFNYSQGPYPDVGDIWSSAEPQNLGGLPFPVKYKQGGLGLWTHWEVDGVSSYTMLVLGEHASDPNEVRKVIRSIPYALGS